MRSSCLVVVYCRHETNEATDKMHRVICNNLFLCFVEHVYNYIKTFNIRFANLSNSSKSQDVRKDNTTLTAQYFGSFTAAQMRRISV